MPTQPGPPPPASQPPRKTAPPPDAARSGPDTPTPKTPEAGAIFRALLDAGAEARVAYTAEKALHTMISEAVAPQLQPFLTEMRRQFDDVDRRFDDVDRRFDDVYRRFDDIDRRFDDIYRRFDDIYRRFDEQDRRLDALAATVAEHDRKLDVIVARLDGMRVLGQVILGALGLLITVLIAVFGFLFMN